MRMNPRYTRTRNMITAPEVPRLKNGGVAMCHPCQRSVYFAGGFLRFLIDRIEDATRGKHPNRLIFRQAGR